MTFDVGLKKHDHPISFEREEHIISQIEAACFVCRCNKQNESRATSTSSISGAFVKVMQLLADTATAVGLRAQGKLLREKSNLSFQKCSFLHSHIQVVKYYKIKMYKSTSWVTYFFPNSFFPEL